MPEFEERDDDVCECGDYRRQHEGGRGACCFNMQRHGVGHGGAPDCLRFVFVSRRHDERG